MSLRRTQRRKMSADSSTEQSQGQYMASWRSLASATLLKNGTSQRSQQAVPLPATSAVAVRSPRYHSVVLGLNIGMCSHSFATQEGHIAIIPSLYTLRMLLGCEAHSQLSASVMLLAYWLCLPLQMALPKMPPSKAA